MATTKAEIEGWLKEGVKQKARWMVVVCDTFDHEDYPVYVKRGEDVSKVVAENSDPNKMSRVMEVYSYKLDLDQQQRAARVASRLVDPILLDNHTSLR
jgi:hypothetical protein